MLWVLCSAIAILVGIAMFAKVQMDLPPELEMLRNKAPSSQVLDRTTAGTQNGAGAQANLAAIPQTGAATGWTFQTDGRTSEASKDFDQTIAGPDGQAYDKPAFAITCYQGHIYARVNSRVRAAGKTPITFNVPGIPAWTAAQNQNWYSSDASRTIAALKARGSVHVRMSFEELGTQNFTFNTNGLSAILGKMPGCKL
jgi:hypothetical protein